MNLGRRVVDGAASIRLGAASRPHSNEVGELSRQRQNAIEQQQAAEATLAQAEAEERELEGASVDAFLGTLAPTEYDRRVADVQRRLVEARRDVDRWATIVAGVTERAIEATYTQIAREQADVQAERDKLERERERLLGKLAEINRADDKLERRLAQIDTNRLPMLAVFDEEAAAELERREKADDDAAVQLAHRRVRGEDVEPPEYLAKRVREHERDVRTDIGERRRIERESLLHRVGYVKLDEHAQIDGPVVRRGFGSDEE